MPHQPTTVTLTLGAPIYAQALYYTAMFSAKPFREALLVYREGGTYTILSPGEDHHGCWVSVTAPLDPPRHVAFMSWPSADWDHDIAAHTLTFEPDTGAFIQELRLPGEAVPRAQHGFAATVASPEHLDPSIARLWRHLSPTADDADHGGRHGAGRDGHERRGARGGMDGGPT